MGNSELTGDEDGESPNYETEDGAGMGIGQFFIFWTEPVGNKDGDVKRFPDRDGDGVEKRGWDSKYDLRNSPPVAIP
ncbi:hypothetical protein Tco_1486628, partial [Tanacetum coccineum]